MAIQRRPSPSDLSETKWQILESLLPPDKQGGRHRSCALREIISTNVYLIRVGGAWRSKPTECRAARD
jgi:putative transposase